MEQSVQVIVTGIHRHPGVSGEQVTRTVSKGVMRTEGQTRILEYEEYLDEEAMEQTEPFSGVATYNKVTIAPSYMEIIRKGSVESALRFAKGEEHDSAYKTPYGEMRSHIVTKHYAVYTLQKGHHIIAEAVYTVSMNGLTMSEVEMRLEALDTTS